MVRTLCLVCVFVHTYHLFAPNYGRPCPCGHDPPGRVPVHTALKKKLPSAHHEDDELALTVPKTLRGLGDQTIWTSTGCNCEITTVSSSQPASVELARPAKQGHQAPCLRATAESLWPAEQFGPWETASASRQECRRRCQSAATAGNPQFSALCTPRHLSLHRSCRFTIRPLTDSAFTANANALSILLPQSPKSVVSQSTELLLS